ncbi:hypothetical protein GGI07_004145 [Coemansia sp. Benny D115]|nr:hypothetical protein GGI07_004145 [Coemansia sp. Benny D115]
MFGAIAKYFQGSRDDASGSTSGAAQQSTQAAGPSAAAAAAAANAPADEAKTQPPPPSPPSMPPPPPLSSRASGQSTLQASGSASSARRVLEVQRSEGIQRVESSSSVYRDFTGTGHDEDGHWNDPPSAVFKALPPAAAGVGKKRKDDTAAVSPAAADGFTMVDGAMTPNGTLVAETHEDAADDDGDAVARELLEALPSLGRPEREALVRDALGSALSSVSTSGDQLDAMARRVLDDTSKRLDVLYSRIAVLDDSMLEALCVLAKYLECSRYSDALGVQKQLLQSHEEELRWLVGVKRLVELAQKRAS